MINLCASKFFTGSQDIWEPQIVDHGQTQKTQRVCKTQAGFFQEEVWCRKKEYFRVIDSKLIHWDLHAFKETLKCPKSLRKKDTTYENLSSFWDQNVETLKQMQAGNIRRCPTFLQYGLNPLWSN